MGYIRANVTMNIFTSVTNIYTNVVSPSQNQYYYSTLAYGLLMIVEVSGNEIVIFTFTVGISDPLYSTADNSKIHPVR